MAESIYVYYTRLGPTYHKVLVYDKGDGNFECIEFAKSIDTGRIQMAYTEYLRPGLEGLKSIELIKTSDVSGGLKNQWDIMFNTGREIEAKSIAGDSEWQYRFFYPFHNSNYTPDYLLWSAGLPLPELDGILGYHSVGSVQGFEPDGEPGYIEGWNNNMLYALSLWGMLRHDMSYDDPWEYYLNGKHGFPLITKKAQVNGSLNVHICPLVLDLDGDGAETTTACGMVIIKASIPFAFRL